MAGRGSKQESGRGKVEAGRSHWQKATLVDVERYLQGIALPATKEDLIGHARDNDAPGDVLKALDMLDDKEYNSVVDISKDVGKYE